MDTKKEKKVIPEKTVVRAIITGIVSYGLLIWFLIAILIVLLKYLSQNIAVQNQLTLNCILSLVGFILIFFLVRLTNRLANFDLFKKCKFNKEKESYVLKKLNLFFVVCAIFFAIAITTGFYIKFSNERINMDISYNQYCIDLKGSKNYTALVKEYKNNLYDEYKLNLMNTLSFALIISIGSVYSILALIPYQKRMLEIYNTDPKHEQV